MIKAIIFDSDDTIVDFSKIAAPCIQKTARKLNLKVPKKYEVNKLWGRSLEFIVNNLWGRKHEKKFRPEYFKIISKYKFKEIKGAKKAINKLKKKYKLAVITAKPRPLLIKNFRDLDINTKIFKLMLSGDDTRFYKPDPRVFNGTRKKLNVKRNQTLYVGDALVDYRAAKSAGFHFVAVLTGNYKKRDFLKAGLKKENILKSVRQLPRWVEKNG